MCAKGDCNCFGEMLTFKVEFSWCVTLSWRRAFWNDKWCTTKWFEEEHTMSSWSTRWHAKLLYGLKMFFIQMFTLILTLLLSSCWLVIANGVFWLTVEQFANSGLIVTFTIFSVLGTPEPFCHTMIHGDDSYKVTQLIIKWKSLSCISLITLLQKMSFFE